MSATDEELQYVHEGGMDHVTYILIMFRYVCRAPLPQSPVPDTLVLSYLFFCTRHEQKIAWRSCCTRTSSS